MATMSQDVLPPDDLARLRAEARGAVENIKEQVTETTQDAVTFVTTPVQEVFNDTVIAKAFALGTAFGVLLTIIAKHLG